MNNQAQLNLNGGTLQFNGNGNGQRRINMGYTNVVINVTNGGVLNSPNARLQVNGEVNVDNGNVNLGNGLLLSTSKNVNVTTGNITVIGATNIEGNLNGGEGNFTFDGSLSNNQHSVTIRSGGRFYMDPYSSSSSPSPVCPAGTTKPAPTNNGSVDFLIPSTVENNGQFYIGDAVVTYHQSTNSQGSAITSVRNGSLTFKNDVSMSNTATLEVTCKGSITIEGNGTFQQNGNFNLGDGSLDIIGDATFQNSGTLNAGDADINFGGNVTIANSGGTINAGSSYIVFEGETFENSGTFDSGTSTFVFAGDGSQVITGSNSDIIFYNLEVEEGADVTSLQNVLVLNNMTVDDDGVYANDNGTTLNVVGDVIGEPQVDVIRPYIIAINIIDNTNITVRFNMALTPGPAQTAGNFTVRSGIPSGSPVIDQITVNPVLIDTHIVAISLTQTTIAEATDYFLHVQNVTNLAGQTTNVPHVKRFGVAPPPIFYSRANGNWNTASSWSLVSHTGATAPRVPSQSGDQVIIGNSNTITVNSNVPLAPLASITVNDTGILTVNQDGNLILATKTITGNGLFSVQSGGSISIGSPDGIAATGLTGNVQTSDRIFSTGANYTYNGDVTQITGTALPSEVNNLTINNANHVELTSNIKVGGNLNLNAGDFIIPTGASIAASSQNYNGGQFRALRTIDIPATDTPGGWRLFSSPVASTHADLFSELTTQGYTGASLGTEFEGNPLMPSVLWYDETFEGTDNQRWRALNNATDATVAGRGLFSFVFGNISTDNRYNQAASTLQVSGQENQGNSNGEVSLPVTFTPEGDDGWNLVGNPFLATIDWDNANGWDLTNIDASIYIWDHSAAEFLTWNGTTGSLGDGLIKPFQGFWIKANDAGASAIVNQDAKTATTNGTFYRHLNDHHEIELVFKMGEMNSRTYIMFSDDARSGLDSKDAFRLRSLADTFIEAYTITRDEDRLAINNLPARFARPIEIPLNIDGMRNNGRLEGEVTLRLGDKTNIPAHWDVEIIDTKMGSATVAQRIQDTYTFTISTNPRMFKGPEGNPNEMHQPHMEEPVLMKSAPSNARFIVRITPNETPDDVPATFELGQNYPNPFNPETTIRYSVPEDGPVQIELFDMTGRRVTTIVNEYHQAGRHETRLNAANLASGVYIYRMITLEGSFTRKMTLIK